jgi:P27 family predicted phage terminase small subunit
MDMDPRAQAVWRRVAPILAECRILTDGDLLALEALCNQEVMWREAMRMTLEKGLIMPKKNKNGEVVGIQESTYSMIAGKKMPELRAMYIQFGLTPAARVRIQAAGDDPNEGWDDF